MIADCAREQDILDAIAANRWPTRSEPELRAHVESCQVCRDLVEVVRPLVDAHDETFEAVRVPPASVVWWRSQIRARGEAARAAARPITIAQGTAAAALLLVAAVLVQTGWARLDGWRQALQSFGGSIQWSSFTMPAFVVQHALLLALGLGTFLIVAPLVVYFTVSDK